MCKVKSESLEQLDAHAGAQTENDESQQHRYFVLQIENVETFMWCFQMTE